MYIYIYICNCQETIETCYGISAFGLNTSIHCIYIPCIHATPQPLHPSSQQANTSQQPSSPALWLWPIAQACEYQPPRFPWQRSSSPGHVQTNTPQVPAFAVQKSTARRLQDYRALIFWSQVQIIIKKTYCNSCQWWDLTNNPIWESVIIYI